MHDALAIAMSQNNVNKTMVKLNALPPRNSRAAEEYVRASHTRNYGMQNAPEMASCLPPRALRLPVRLSSLTSLGDITGEATADTGLAAASRFTDSGADVAEAAAVPLATT